MTMSASATWPDSRSKNTRVRAALLVSSKIARFSLVGAIVIRFIPSPRFAGLIDCAFDCLTRNFTPAAFDQLLSARSTAPNTSLPSVMVPPESVSDDESAILIVLVGHLIFNSWEATGSKEEGCEDTPSASNTTIVKTGRNRRIRMSVVNQENRKVDCRGTALTKGDSNTARKGRIPISAGLSKKKPPRDYVARRPENKLTIS
jgi:hypothetical protein